MASWNPSTYLQFADERSRPFFELLARVDADELHQVVDLGCGPGQLTATLAERWSSASVLGVDSSQDMIDAAMAHATDRVRFQLADIRAWALPTSLDLIVSNAALQWVPDHRALLPRLVDALTPGGWLAFQVPGNFDEPSHRLLRELAVDSRFASATSDLVFPSAHGAEVYLADLSARGCAVDAWETTYLHVLHGPDPVFRWISATGARSVLQALTGSLRDEFVDDYKALLREAYPSREHGTVLPFRRVFCIARRA
jgi:trans-aconitate 2-methyltransferase